MEISDFAPSPHDEFAFYQRSVLPASSVRRNIGQSSPNAFSGPMLQTAKNRRRGAWTDGPDASDLQRDNARLRRVWALVQQPLECDRIHGA
jgi:hypothetical protein